MFKRSRSIHLLTGVSLALACSAALHAGAAEPTLNAQALSAASTEPESGKQAEMDGGAVYIVQLAEPPVAMYRGGIAGFEATSPVATGKKFLDPRAPNARAYEAHLEQQQSKLLRAANRLLGRDLRVTHDYQHAFNGFAVELNATEAAMMASQPGVVRVMKERHEQLLTDNGPAWINAPNIWDQPGFSGQTTKGEGAVIAILDSGINSQHPSFAAIGGDGHVHQNPLGAGNWVPGSYCDTVDPGFCNDKLIGAWTFVNEAVTPEDSGGHGSHVASIAAGNVVDSATLFAPTTQMTRSISGVAPHANIIMYDVCIGTCPQSALVAAVNQAIIDAGILPNGIAALNYSISGGANPYNDPVELGFLAASEAGIYVSTSAGNDGPGAGTTGHLSPWLASTASMTHDRRVINSLVDMDAGGGHPDITGLGFTAGYGPAEFIYSGDLEGAFTGATQCYDPGAGMGPTGTSPFPPGTFNGEIVVCTRGTGGRVEKGGNVLFAGAGGYVLIDNGNGLVGDAHLLPGVHITADDGASLVAYLAANPGATGSITGFELDIHPDNGDVLAGSSSRGPSGALETVKPDIAAPGVDIFGAEAAGQAPAPEYQFLSGTSMASPHHAGAAALLSVLHPNWTPHQIRSALMMTATNENTVTLDGSPTTPHDVGAGRVDLTWAANPGLVLNETFANFMAANPETGGDPKTLNMASMQNNNCVGTCSWQRTVHNPMTNSGHWALSVDGSGGVEYTATPGDMKVKARRNQVITVTADTTLAPEGWHFGQLNLDRNSTSGPDLHMPIAVFSSRSTNGNVFNKTVSDDTATAGDLLSYEISIVNGNLGNLIELTDVLPPGISGIPGSESLVLTDGVTVDPLSFDGDTLTWSGFLDTSALAVTPSPSPFGYFELANLGIGRLACSSVCDDTSILLNVPSFTYAGIQYDQLRMGSNGIVAPGNQPGAFINANQLLPDPAAPNPIAAFWTDLDLDGTSPTDSGAGDPSAAVLSAGGSQWIVLEWKGAEEWNVPGITYSFQVWISTDASATQGIWIVYDHIGGLPANLTVGAENDTGTAGDTYYYNGAGTAPAVGTDLLVQELPAGSAVITFDAEALCSSDRIVNEAQILHDGTTDRAIAVTACE